MHKLVLTVHYTENQYSVFSKNGPKMGRKITKKLTKIEKCDFSLGIDCHVKNSPQNGELISFCHETTQFLSETTSEFLSKITNYTGFLGKSFHQNPKFPSVPLPVLWSPGGGVVGRLITVCLCDYISQNFSSANHLMY